MNRNELIKKVEKELGFKVVGLEYYPQYRNCETKCWDIKVSYQSQEYKLEANTINELLEVIVEELM